MAYLKVSPALQKVRDEDDWIRLFRVESREELEMLQSKNLGILEAVKEVKEMNLSKLIKA